MKKKKKRKKKKRRRKKKKNFLVVTRNLFQISRKLIVSRVIRVKKKQIW